MTMSSYAKLGTVVAALALAACGGDSNSGTPDGGGGGGAGSGGSSSGCNIPCFASLFDQCTPSGTCIIQDANICYSNGVKAITAVNVQTFMSTMTFYKPNGQVCFSASSGLQGESIMATYKNPAGATIATATSDTKTGKTTIMCSGKAYDLSECSAVGGGSSSSGGGSGGQCTQGTCM